MKLQWNCCIQLFASKVYNFGNRQGRKTSVRIEIWPNVYSTFCCENKSFVIASTLSHACNLKTEMGNICLQSFGIGTKYACNVENEFSMSIVCPYWNRLQAYIVCCSFEIASISSPRWILDIRSQLLSSLQAYLDLFWPKLQAYLVIKIIAIICGPSPYRAKAFLFDMPHVEKWGIFKVVK